MHSTLQLIKVDYSDPEQTKTLIELLQMYAKEPMGGGQKIASQVINSLPGELAKRPYMHSFLVYENEIALAFANCIQSFSTFSGQDILNIHDFAVMPEARGKSVSLFLMAGIEKAAKQLGCTKLTLEVLEGNQSAIRAYEKAGFAAYQLKPEMGNAMFWQKSIG